MKNRIWSNFQRHLAAFDFALNYTVLMKSKPFTGLYLCRSEVYLSAILCLKPLFFFSKLTIHFFYVIFNKVQFSLLPQGIILVDPADSYNRIVQISPVLPRAFKKSCSLTQPWTELSKACGFILQQWQTVSYYKQLQQTDHNK